MNTRIGITFALAPTLGLACAEVNKVEAPAQVKSAPKRQALCPVMGGAVNTNLYADAEGKRVYFCCGGCISAFKKDPAKYIAKLEKDGVSLEKAPAAAAKKE